MYQAHVPVAPVAPVAPGVETTDQYYPLYLAETRKVARLTAKLIVLEENNTSLSSRLKTTEADLMLAENNLGQHQAHIVVLQRNVALGTSSASKGELEFAYDQWCMTNPSYFPCQFFTTPYDFSTIFPFNAPKSRSGKFKPTKFIFGEEHYVGCPLFVQYIAYLEDMAKRAAGPEQVRFNAIYYL